MANYSTVDGYKFGAQINYGWGLSLNMTGKAPEVSKRIFDTYEHMLYYVNDYNDSCVEGLTLKVMADGEKNGVYFVAKIGTEGADKAFANDGEVIKLASEGKVNDNVTDLQEALDDEIAARKAVDGQTGQTYAANSDAYFISGATSLNDADLKLHEAIKQLNKNNEVKTFDLSASYTSEQAEELERHLSQYNEGYGSIGVVLGNDVKFNYPNIRFALSNDKATFRSGLLLSCRTQTRNLSNDGSIIINSTSKTNYYNLTIAFSTEENFFEGYDKNVNPPAHIDNFKNYMMIAEVFVKVTIYNGGPSIPQSYSYDGVEGVHVYPMYTITEGDGNKFLADDGTYQIIKGNQIKLSDNYNSVVYPSETGDKTFIPAVSGQSLDNAIKAVETNVSVLVDAVLENENVTAAAITEIKESVGLDENLKYVKNTSANYIQNATTFSDADNLLDSAIKAEVIARENAISNLSSASTEGLNDEIETRQRIEGQSGTAYTKNTTSSYISGATSMNDADVKLDSAIKNLKLTAVTGTELTRLGENVKDAYKFIDELGTRHGDYVKIYKDSSLEDVTLSGQTLYFTYILANGNTTTVPVDLSAFLSEEEYSAGLQVNNHIISVKIDEESESFLTVSENGVKLSGVQNAINSAVNNLDSTITSDDTALVNVQVKQENGIITDVVVIGNDIDCGTF